MFTYRETSHVGTMRQPTGLTFVGLLYALEPPLRIIAAAVSVWMPGLQGVQVDQGSSFVLALVQPNA